LVQGLDLVRGRVKACGINGHVWRHWPPIEIDKKAKQPISVKDNLRKERKRVFVEYDGHEVLLTDLAAELKIPATRIAQRLKMGWPIDRAAMEPIGHRNKVKQLQKVEQNNCLSGRLKNYHLVWLSNRPDRTEEWLLRMMDEGFHMHHLDGNHDNDDPDNLVLIEGGDHMRVHGMKHFRPGWRISKRLLKNVLETETSPVNDT